MAEVADIFPPEIRDDLSKSGVEAGLMRCRTLGPNEIAATGVAANSQGYVIPYFNIRNQPIPFYRVRLFNAEPKYRQLLNQPNHIYFPPGFWELVNRSTCRYVMLTEGEKKAAAAVQRGIACCAVGGVDSWRNRIIYVPKGSSVVQGQKGAIIAKLPAGSETSERQDTLAMGLLDLINFLLHKDIPLIICYDTDEYGRTSAD